MKCPTCSLEVFDPTDRFCRNCQADLIGLMSECSACHAVFHVGKPINGCPYCGAAWSPISASPESYEAFLREVPA
jgi:hypothetical protein